MGSQLPARYVNCPTCKRKVRWSPENPFRPFCSERCRAADMGAWATETYRIADATDPDFNETNPAPPLHRPQ